MPNENRIQIILTTDASGAVTGIKLAGEATQKLENTTKASSSGIQAAWNAMSVKVASWMYVIEKAKGYWDAFMQSVTLGAKAMQAEESFRIAADAANINADRMIAAMRRASAGTIDESDIMQKAVKGIVQDLNENQLVSIMEAARVSARIAGEDVRAAYETITDAIANNMPRALRKYGLLAKEDISLVNAALAAGVDDVRIYDLAMANAAKQAAIAGKEEQSLAEKIQEHNANMQNIMEQFGKYSAVIWDFLRGPGKEYKDWWTDLAESGQLGDTNEFINASDIMGQVPKNKAAEIAYAERQKQLIVEQTKAAIEAKKNAEKALAAADAYADWAVQVANLNPLLTEETKRLAEVNRQAESLIKKGVARAKVEETLALAEYYIKQKEVIEAEKELADWQKEMYRMAEEELAYFTAMQGTELDKQIAQIDAAAAKIGANLGKLGLDTEEFETRWAEVARVNEIVKQTARDESHKKILQQLKEQGEQYQALFDQQRQYQISNYNDIWSSLSGTAGQSGDYATGANMITSSMKGITDVMTGQDKYSQEYERAREHYNQMRELYQQNVNDYGGSEAAAWELSEAYQQMIIARDQQTASMRMQTTQSMFGTMAGLAQAFYTAGGKQSQAAFNLYKAFAIAEATIAGYKATINAYEFGTKFGGPVVGAIMAATAAATAAMYIASIASQTMSSIATPTVTSSGGTSSISTTAATSATEQKTETRPIVVNFHNYGFISDGAADELARELVPKLQKAVNDGAH